LVVLDVGLPRIDGFATLERIFEPYVRLADPGDDRTGTGLGLSIARRVFVTHGGDISAVPATPCGLCVRVRLPLVC